ncbi:uncharacterized protein LOC118195385 [Stegodyphus dumicola]|uniref:uncharacterized protein LOC118195385 n=1 Tax=Stegodyphus dumicola TaxID=202533 RepID=UPI0015ABEC5D|nr:uncharacterized protein LOC118195385 [Stegodyphus dumicola]
MQAHAGVAETLTQIREKFWILKGRQRVKSNINKCVICYRFKAKPLSQDIAPLPIERITEANPFEVVGLDFAGPMSTKDEELETVLIEIEAILNSRPLTYVYSEVGEPEPLTPAHFLVGRRLTSLPSGKILEPDSTKENLTRRYKYRLRLSHLVKRDPKRNFFEKRVVSSPENGLKG